MLLIGSQQVAGNGFPDGGIVALGAGAIAFLLALNPILAGSGRLGFVVEGRKQDDAGRERQGKYSQPDKGFCCHGSISFRHL
jgi:hypothetical protein